MAFGYLKNVLKEVADTQDGLAAFKENKELEKAHKAAKEVFGSPAPVFRQVHDRAAPVDIQARALARVSLYLNRKGLNWRVASRETVIKFLKEHWVSILRVLLSILVLF